MNRLRELAGFVREKISGENLTEAGWVMAGQMVVIVYGFAVVKILSRMGEAEYGRYALILTIAAFLSMVLYGPLTQGFIRYYYHYAERKQSRIFTGYTYRAVLTIGLFLLPLALMFLPLAETLFPSDKAAGVILSALFIMVLKTGEFQNSHLNTLRRRRANSLFQALEKITIISLLFLLYYYDRLSLSASLAAMTASMLFFSAIKFFYTGRLAHSEPAAGNVHQLKRQMRSTILAYSLPFLVWGSAAWLQSNGERWIIANMLSTADVGIYAVMMSLINVFIVVPNNIIADFMTPLIFSRFSDLNDTAKTREGIKFINITVAAVAAFTVLSVLITLFAGRILIILISSQAYTKYAYLLPVISVGAGLFYIGQALALLGMSLNLPKKYITPKIISGVLSVLFNTLFIFIFGILGTAITAVITGLVYSLYVLIINRKILADIQGKK